MPEGSSETPYITGSTKISRRVTRAHYSKGKLNVRSVEFEEKDANKLVFIVVIYCCFFFPKFAQSKFQTVLQKRVKGARTHVFSDNLVLAF